MRLPTRTTDRAAVNRYLLPNEQQVITVRRHPAVLIGPSVLTLGGLIVAGVLTATVLHGNGALVTVVWVAWLVLFVRMIWKAINWAVDFFVVTSHRILLTSGVLTRKVGMMPLAKVTDMSFQRSFAGRLLGYGEFIVESAGQDQALRNIDHIPYPEQLYLEVCGMLFPPTPAPDCKMCNGSGNVVLAEERRLVTVTCPNCDGSGKAPDPNSRYDETVVDGANPNTDPNED